MSMKQVEWYRREEKFSADTDIYKYDFVMDADGPGSVLQALQEDIDDLRAEGYTSFQITITSDLPGMNHTRVLSPYRTQIYANSQIQ